MKYYSMHLVFIFLVSQVHPRILQKNNFILSDSYNLHNSCLNSYYFTLLIYLHNSYYLNNSYYLHNSYNVYNSYSKAIFFKFFSIYKNVK